MNIHINKTTRFQSWEGQTIFGEYPVYIRPGNFTVTLMFHDKESINRLCQLLIDTIFEIESKAELDNGIHAPVKLRKPK
jgi:hypothetical protein